MSATVEVNQDNSIEKLTCFMLTPKSKHVASLKIKTTVHHSKLGITTPACLKTPLKAKTLSLFFQVHVLMIKLGWFKCLTKLKIPIYLMPDIRKPDYCIMWEIIPLVLISWRVIPAMNKWEHSATISCKTSSPGCMLAFHCNNMELFPLLRHTTQHTFQGTRMNTTQFLSNKNTKPNCYCKQQEHNITGKQQRTHNTIDDDVHVRK